MSLTSIILDISPDKKQGPNAALVLNTRLQVYLIPAEYELTVAHWLVGCYTVARIFIQGPVFTARTGA